MNNIIILAQTQEEVQGMIRAVEELDTGHTLAICYGKDTNAITETETVLADVLNASILTTPEVNLDVMIDSRNKQGKQPLHTYTITLPDQLKEHVMARQGAVDGDVIDYSNDVITKLIIEYICNTYKDLVNDLIPTIPMDD